MVIHHSATPDHDPNLTKKCEQQCFEEQCYTNGLVCL